MKVTKQFKLTAHLTMAALAVALLVPTASDAVSASTRVNLVVIGGNFDAAQTGARGFAISSGSPELQEEWTASIGINADQGTGASWRLNGSLAYAYSGDGPQAEEGEVPLSSLVETETISNDVDSTNTPPVSNISTPIALDDEPEVTPAALYDAAPRTGMGNFTLELRGTAELPEGAPAGSYKPVLELEEVSGP